MMVLSTHSRPPRASHARVPTSDPGEVLEQELHHDRVDHLDEFRPGGRTRLARDVCEGSPHSGRREVLGGGVELRHPDH